MDKAVQPDGGLRVRLFGSLEIEDGERTLGPRELGGVRPKQVLEILLAARGHRVPTERLAESLWGDDAPANASASIQTFVSVLRRALVRDRKRARELLVTEVAGYRLAVELLELDLDVFDRLLERAGEQPRWVARRTLEEALALVRGDVLEDEPYSDWAHELRLEYRARVIGAHLDAAAVALAERDLADALAHADAAAALDPYSERALRTAMLALYALGRAHESLARYRSFGAALDNDLGLTPSPELRLLEAAVLRQEDADGLLPRLSVQERSDEREVALIGRAEELTRIEAAVRRGVDRGFAVVRLEGEAGAGKTRLLHELTGDLEGIRVGWATCSVLEQHLDYVPLAAALRQASLDRLADGRGELSRILPELGRGGDRAPDEVETLEALVRVLAAHAPVVLLLDDVQFADAATVAALSYLQRRASDLRGAVVLGARSEHVPAYHPVRALRADTVVELGPLTRADLDPLGIPGLFESTGGNPRFVADVLANVDSDGPSRALADMVIDQCRQEGPRAYRLLVAASLLDPPFEPVQLEAMLGVDVTGIAERLETLCERGILRADGIGFAFRHELVREVLLDDLSPARVRLLQQQLEPVRLPEADDPDVYLAYSMKRPMSRNPRVA